MERVAAVLPKTFQKLGLTKKFRAETMIYRWGDIVGSDIAQHTRPVSLQFGLLFVAVNNPVWMHHLSLMKEKLIRQINQFAQMELLKDIKFQSGAVKIAPGDMSEQPDLSLQRQLKQIVLSKEDVIEIRALLSEVQSEPLQKQLFSLLVKEKRLQRYKEKHGYHPCPQCGILCPKEEETCFICSLQSKQNKIEVVYKFLYDAPWLAYRELIKFLSASEFEYNKAKERLIEKFSQKIFESNPPPLTEETLVMLLTGAKPDQLNQALIERTLRKVRRKKYVFTPRQ